MMPPEGTSGIFAGKFTRRISSVMFFAVVFLVGFSIYKDYGVPFDERALRYYGEITAAYINEKLGHPFMAEEATRELPKLQQYDDRDHGSVLEVFLTGIEVIFRVRFPDVYFVRHFATFALFGISLIFFFKIIEHRYKNWKLGIIGCLFLILSPRMFADAFYNSKDIAFMSMYIITTYTAIRFIEEKSFSRALAHALASGLLIAIRVPGMILPAITVLMICVDGVKSAHITGYIKKHGLAIGVYLTGSIITMIASWPTLWEHPLTNLVYVIRRMGKFPWPGEVLYLGGAVPAASLPWHYLPVWISVTTPLQYLAGFFAGAATIIFRRFQNRFLLYRTPEERQDLFHFSTFLCPLLAVILLRSEVYDGWRHLYFVYPAFLLVCISGFMAVGAYLSKRSVRLSRTLLISVIGVSCLTTCWTMVRMHPFQMVYFNALAGNNIERKFDCDYWGLSYRTGLEEILRRENDPSLTIPVYQDGVPVRNNTFILRTADFDRIRLVPFEGAKYFITNYREVLYDRDKFLDKYRLTGDQELYSLVVDGVRIMSVYRLR